MKKLIIVIMLLLASIVTCYILKGSKNNQRHNPLRKQKSVLDGILVEHPKYFLRYYIQNISTKQECAILHTELVKDILPGSYIRAMGEIKSFLDYEGYPNNIANYTASWIYMDIDKITSFGQPENAPNQIESTVVTTKSLNQLPVIGVNLRFGIPSGDLVGRKISDLVKIQDVHNLIILQNNTSAPSNLHVDYIEDIIKEDPIIQSFYYIDPNKGYPIRLSDEKIDSFFTVLLQTSNDCIGFDLGREKIRIFNGAGDGWIKK